jgi:nuclear pore complex protein Nup155
MARLQMQAALLHLKVCMVIEENTYIYFILFSAPLRTSTPQSGGYTNGYTHTPQHPVTPGGTLDGDQSILAGSKVMNSPRHEALFTCFGRLVKNIWRRQLCGTRQTNNVSGMVITFYDMNYSKFCAIFQVYSLLTQQEVEQVGQHLNALKRAIDQHSLITAPTMHHHQPYQYQVHQQQRISPTGRTNEMNRKKPPPISPLFLFFLNDSLVVDQERQTLQKLRGIVGITCEVLALWAVLLEHELHAIFVMLMPDVQKCLLSWTLDDLVRSKNDVSS